MPVSLSNANLDSSQLETILAQVCEFYRLAEERNRIFVETLQAHLAGPAQGLCLAVMGGFHVPRVAQRLQQQGISYAILNLW